MKHYEAFLGQAGHTGTFNMEGLCWNVLDPDIALAMVQVVSVNEVKEAIFFMGNDKSPGPDGYTAALFKETCAFKVDIQKAYDTVDWDFLRVTLDAFGFHPRMVAWIMKCVTTTLFSICINGSLHGYFKGNRGLRQGDPLSPYLFTLIIEVLTLMLHRKVRDSEMFTYHRYCSRLELINLCFADDLFLFAHGDVHLAKVVMDALDEFKLASGLTPSLPKSTSYFCNVNHVKIVILHILPFEEGRLSVKYLGVLLVSSRLVYRDCRELIEKVRGCVMDWKNKSLSAAGRLQLIQSVLGSRHIYWASMFIIHSRVLLDVEQIIRGSLGIRRLDLFNKALMVSHLWNLISLKESLWVKWIHVFKLKGRCFWEVPCHGNMTRGWRKILQLHPLIREFVWYRIGDGLKASAWFDSWCHLKPISRIVSSRDIYRAGYDLDTKVNELIVNGLWGWPNEWFSKYPLLCSITPPILSNTHDRFEVVTWHDVVWFSNYVPRFSFILWIAIHGRLKTQDMIRHWDIWDHMKALADISNVMGDYKDAVEFLSSHVKRRTCKSVIAKLVFSASVYYIWQDRNARIFSNQKRSSCQLKEVIHSAVRIKLLSCSFKKTRSGLVFARIWKLPEFIFSSKTR
nr:hypothetical protein [Tanacetum cinerariifolium]